MSAKDFILVANVIKSFPRGSEVRFKLIARFTTKFEANYPKFDKQKFLAYIEAEEV